MLAPKLNTKCLASSMRHCLMIKDFQNKHCDPYILRFSNQASNQTAPSENVNSEGTQTTNKEEGVFLRILKGKNKDADSLENSKSIAQLSSENKSLMENVSELKDKYTRALAETENIRQRMNKEVDKVKDFAIQGFCKDILEVADILTKACESVPPELLEQIENQQSTLTDNGIDIKTQFLNLYQGLMMTERQLQKVFAKNGLKQISPAQGDKFNPHLHEALFSSPIPEMVDDSETPQGKTDKESKISPGSIAVVTKIGYQLKDRTIRPALVGVYN